MVQAFSKKDFMEKLDRMVSDRHLYESCKEGCDKITKDFDRKKLAARMLEVIEEVGSGSSK